MWLLRSAFGRQEIWAFLSLGRDALYRNSFGF
jgi:hypothetical protein